MSHRFARNGWPRASEIVGPVTVTGSATPHTEGAYAQLVASAARDICGMMVRPNADITVSGVDTSMLLTLAVGAAASEVDVVSNLNFSGASQRSTLWIPLRIPAGSRVAAKIRAEQVSDTFDALICFLYNAQAPGWGGYSACDTYGALTDESRGLAVSNTAGAYTEFAASITKPIRAINISGGITSSGMNSAIHTVDVAVGGVGSEVIVGTWLSETTSGEMHFARYGPPFLEVPIPAGSRIAVKKNTTLALGVCVHGWR